MKRGLTVAAMAALLAIAIAGTWRHRATAWPCVVDSQYVSLLYDEHLLEMPPDGERIELTYMLPGEALWVTFNYRPGGSNDQPLWLYEVPVLVRGPDGDTMTETSVFVEPRQHNRMSRGRMPLSYCLNAPKRVSDDPTQLRTLFMRSFKHDPPRDPDTFVDIGEK